jgi:hypothetical protein
MALSCEQSRRWIESDPTGARNVGFGPSVQIGEIAFGACRTVERLHVAFELNQIAGGEARGDAQRAHDLHEQPSGVAA